MHAELGEEVVIIRRRMPHPDSLVEQELTGLAIAASSFRALSGLVVICPTR